MTEKKITTQEAELVIRLYELRREETMRKSRDIVNGQFWPSSLEDLLEVYNWDHPFNAALRQTSSYWEMVYGMAAHGAIDPDYLIENSGEGMVLFAKILPYLDEIRTRFGATAFQHAEWISTHSEKGRETLARIQGRLKAFEEMATRGN